MHIYFIVIKWLMQMDTVVKELPNKEELVLYPSQRMRLLFESAEMVIDTVSDIPIERLLEHMNKMWDMALVYKKEGEIERAAVLFLRYVSVNVATLSKHVMYPYIDWEIKNAVHKKANEGLAHTDKIRETLGRLYEDESMRLFNNIVNKSKFGKTALEKYKNGMTSFGDIVKDIRVMELDDFQKSMRLVRLPPVPEVPKTVAIPSDIVEKYKQAVGEEDLVGVLLGNNPHSHYFIVSHILLPGKEHTGENAEKFFHKIRESVAPEMGMVPLGLIHSCTDYFLCHRIKVTPRPGEAPVEPPPPSAPQVYPPPPIDHHKLYSACPHLFAQHLYQTLNPISVTLIARDVADNQCVWITSAGMITAARRSLYNGEVTAKVDHVVRSTKIKTKILDLRGTEMELTMEDAERRENEEEAKENVQENAQENANVNVQENVDETAQNNENSEN